MADIGMENDRKDRGHVSFKKMLSQVRCYLCGSPRCVGGYLVRGLIIIIPLAVTLWVIIWVFNLIDGLLAPILMLGLGRHYPGLGFAIILVSIIFLGFLGEKIGQQKFFDSAEAHLVRIPVAGTIYGGIREILNSFNKANAGRFLEVVLIEYPRRGIYTVGLVTRETKNKDGTSVLSVFIPTAPTPAGGYLVIVPESEVVRTSMSISDAMKLVVSIGRVSREDLVDMLEQFPELEKRPP